MYQLGSIITLPNGIFSDTSRYLGITVGVEPKISPHSRFISTAYAFEAGNISWSNISGMPAGSADGVDNEGLSKLGDTLTGSLLFDAGNNGVMDGQIYLSANSTDLLFSDNGNIKSYIYGHSNSGNASMIMNTSVSVDRMYKKFWRDIYF